ncbi:MAG: N-acetylmuramoyl-L-alanine amidase [Nitrospirales bacterium]
MDRPLLSLSQPASSAFLYQTASRSSNIQVRNVRAHRHKKFTRIVLDLSGKLAPGPKESRTSTHFHIELPNTTIPTDITAKLTNDKFPPDLTLNPTATGSVLLSVPMQGWTRYKWYLLNGPSRLVLDLYPSSKGAEVVQTPPAPAPAKEPEVILPPPPVKRDFLIVLDPGHGGKDPGALGKSGTREKDAVLSIALQLRDILQKEPSVKVLMTREKDEFIELEDRAKFANQEKGDLFLSIHINSHPQTSIKGLEFYHFGEASDPRALEVAARENGTPLKDNAPAWQFILADKLNDKKIDDSRELAWTTKKALVKHLHSFYKIKDHGVKTAPFFVLRMTTMPAILAEIAFISNPTEEKLLKSATFQKRMAHGIFEGIKAYITPLQTALQ